MHTEGLQVNKHHQLKEEEKGWKISIRLITLLMLWSFIIELITAFLHSFVLLFLILYSWESKLLSKSHLLILNAYYVTTPHIFTSHNRHKALCCSSDWTWRLKHVVSYPRQNPLPTTRLIIINNNEDLWSDGLILLLSPKSTTSPRHRCVPLQSSMFSDVLTGCFQSSEVTQHLDTMSFKRRKHCFLCFRFH